MFVKVLNYMKASKTRKFEVGVFQIVLCIWLIPLSLDKIYYTSPEARPGVQDS